MSRQNKNSEVDMVVLQSLLKIDTCGVPVSSWRFKMLGRSIGSIPALCGAGLVLVVLSVVIGSTAHGQAPARVDRLSFRHQVAPILVKKCLGCHHERKASGGLSMATFASLRRGGKMAGETILEPGDPDDSALIESVREGAAPRMPYKLPPLTQDEIATLSRWVKEGAEFDGPSVAETPLASLVDRLAGLPKIALKVPVGDPITSVTFSIDGQALAAAVGRQVVLYDPESGKVVATMGDHPGPVNSVSFSPDGTSLIAAGGRAGLFGSVTVWDRSKRERRLELKGHSDSILSAVFTADGKGLATAGYDKQILIWDLVRGTVIRSLKDHSDAVYGLAFSPDGKTLASCAADRTVKLWDWATGKRKETLSESTAELYTLAFTPDGSRILSAGVDRSIRIWRIDRGGVRLERSVFGHDAPIVRLTVSVDGRMLASCAEDRTLRLWNLDTLTPQSVIPNQADWVQALAFSPDSRRLALGRYDGFLALWDTKAGKLGLVLREPPVPQSSEPAKLVRNASLDPPRPRGGVRGSRVRVALSGQGVGRATAIILPEPGLSAAIVPAARPDDNRVEFDLTIAADTRVGLHHIGVITPLGVPAMQPFAVAADPEVPEKEPNDVLNGTGTKPLPVTALPANLVGSIDQPGDVDLFPFEAKVGQQLVFQVLARAIGSQLRPELIVLDPHGNIQAHASAGSALLDPVLTFTAQSDGLLFLQVADADYGGSGGHFYRIAAGQLPIVQSVFPLGVERGTTAKVEVSGSNLVGVQEVSLPVRASLVAGTITEVPVVLPGGRRPYQTRTVVVTDGPASIEQETNDTVSHAQELNVPGGVSGHIGHDGDVDFYRFRAKKGETIVVELYGHRLGSPIDSIVDVLDAHGKTIPRAVLRPVDQTEAAFRDNSSKASGIRLTRWNNLAINDYILWGREVGRIQALPRNPDDDSVFWNQRGQRLGMFETTPEQHPVGQPMYKVEIHPPGTVFPPGGVATTTLTYENDDGGPSYSKDSRVTFTPPADGDYTVRVADVRGLGGDDFGYHLVLRRPRPSFHVDLGTENPNIPRGGTTLVAVNVTRLDDFDAAVEIKAESLPTGIKATPAVVDRGELSGMMALSADATAPAFSPPTWRVVARQVGDLPSGSSQVQEIDPGGPAGGWITVTPPPNLKVSARPNRVVIHPGEQVSMTLAVERGPAFRGRVPIDVKNLPQGVRVLNIGLNGVLITEAQAERTVFLLAEPWAQPMDRPFYAVGKAESAGTEHSSSPIELVVGPAQTGTGIKKPSGTP